MVTCLVPLTGRGRTAIDTPSEYDGNTAWIAVRCRVQMPIISTDTTFLHAIILLEFVTLNFHGFFVIEPRRPACHDEASFGVWKEAGKNIIYGWSELRLGILVFGYEVVCLGIRHLLYGLDAGYLADFGFGHVQAFGEIEDVVLLFGGCHASARPLTFTLGGGRRRWQRRGRFCLLDWLNRYRLWRIHGSHQRRLEMLHFHDKRYPHDNIFPILTWIKVLNNHR